MSETTILGQDVEVEEDRESLSRVGEVLLLKETDTQHADVQEAVDNSSGLSHLLHFAN